MEIAGKPQEAHRFGSEKMSQRNVPGILRAAQEMRQTLCPIEIAQPIGQVDPIPRLFENVFGQAASQLPFEYPAGVIGAQFGKRTHLDHVLYTWPQAGLDGGYFAAFQQVAEACLDRFHGSLVELTPLEQVDV